MHRSRLAFAVAILAVSGCATEITAPERQDSSAQSCDRSSFGIAKTGLCTEGHCPMPNPPPEIAQIRRGVYVYEADTYSGSWDDWTGVDLDMRRVVKVERFAGAVIGGIKSLGTSSSTDYVRETDRTVEIVREETLGDETLDEVSCSANRLWADTMPQRGKLYDLTVRIGLRDGDATKIIGEHDLALVGFAGSFTKEFLSKFSEPRSSDMDRLKASIINLTSHGWYSQIGDRVLFDSNSYSLTDSAKAVLDHWVFFLTKNGKDRLMLEGHSDDRGSVELNRALGLKRAVATKDYLVGHGMEASRIGIVTYGKERPAVLIGPSGDVEGARAQNRRVVGIIE